MQTSMETEDGAQGHGIISDTNMPPDWSILVCEFYFKYARMRDIITIISCDYREFIT